jgi:transposase
MRQESKAKGITEIGAGRLVSREELIAGHKEDGRAVYRREAKAKLVAAAIKPGASVARIAREHEVNANQLHLWIRQSRRPCPPAGKAAKVRAGIEKAAVARTARTQTQIADARRIGEPTAPPKTTLANLLPVKLTTDPAPGSPAPLRTAAHAGLVVEIGEACIRIDGAVDVTTLATVIACLRAPVPSPIHQSNR